MAETPKVQSELSQVQHQPEAAPAFELPGHVEITTLPMSDLPDVNTKPEPGMDFWSRDLLRPGMEGPNWHNIPIAEFGITYQGDQATLSLPDSERINALVEKYNPGGLRFVEGQPLEPAATFLDMLYQGQFPESDDSDYESLVRNYFSAFMNLRRDPDEPPEEVETLTNAKEHGRLDHAAALLTFPKSELDKVQALIHKTKSLNNPEYESLLTGSLDSVLQTISCYALVPSHGTELEEDFKANLRGEILFILEKIAYEAGEAGAVGDPNQMSSDELDDKLLEAGFSIEFDFAAIDAQVEKIQLLRPHGVRSLGMVAVRSEAA